MPAHGFKLRFATTRLAWKGKKKSERGEERRVDKYRTRDVDSRLEFRALRDREKLERARRRNLTLFPRFLLPGLLPLLPLLGRLIYSKADPPSPPMRSSASYKGREREPVAGRESKYLSILLISIFL